MSGHSAVGKAIRGGHTPSWVENGSIIDQADGSDHFVRSYGKSLTRSIVPARHCSRSDCKWVYSPFYQALPRSERPQPKSGGRSQDERSCWPGSFPTDLAPSTCGNWTKTELSSILDDAATYDEAFDSRTEVDNTFTALREAIEQADLEYPGLIDRNRLLGQEPERDQRATRPPTGGRRGFHGATRLVGALLFGDCPFSQDTGGLQYVNSETVRRGAQALQEVEPETLFGDANEDYLAEDYRSWRDLYRCAAERGEAVLIY